MIYVFYKIMMLISLFYKFLLEEKEYVQLLNSKSEIVGGLSLFSTAF